MGPSRGTSITGRGEAERAAVCIARILPDSEPQNGFIPAARTIRAMNARGLGPVVDTIADLVAAAAGSVVLVGVAGSVCVGKTTMSERLRGLLAPVSTEIVSTDGFLHPNAELERRGLTTRKGFPESYDEAALLMFLGRLRGGTGGLSVPVHSHVTYDISTEPRVLTDAAVVIVEGVNALQFAGDLDLTIYLDAAEPLIEAWYTQRLLEQFAAAPPGSFYASLGFDEDAQRAFAREVWATINRVNLEQCILPTRERATVVVEKGADHEIERVRFVGAVS